jgi:hypothetical protein
MLDRLEFMERQCVPLEDEIKKTEPQRESEDIKALS